jgi:hypothetical protein
MKMFGLRFLVAALFIANYAESLSSFDPSPVRRVVVVGGTHGNEYTGNNQQSRFTLSFRFTNIASDTLYALSFK